MTYQLIGTGYGDTASQFPAGEEASMVTVTVEAVLLVPVPLNCPATGFGSGDDPIHV